MRKLILTALAAGMMLSAAPAFAQESSYKLGPLWDASRIDVEDGQFENYMDFLNTTYRDNQSFAKSQGWILDYYILNSVNARDGEPDIILLTRYADFPSVAEIERRDTIMSARMKQDDHQAEAASGDRGKMRRLMGTVLYRELTKR